MVDFGIFLTLLGFGYFFGRRNEQAHYKRILKRESELADITIHTAKTLDPIYQQSFVAVGNVVISVDYFKLVTSSLQSLLGGRITVYESLLDRARREAVIRMKQMAKENGSKCVINLRLETASLNKGDNKAVGCVEVFAYGTALY